MEWLVYRGEAGYPLPKEGSLSPLRKMQRYLSQGEAGESDLSLLFFLEAVG